MQPFKQFERFERLKLFEPFEHLSTNNSIPHRRSLHLRRLEHINALRRGKLKKGVLQAFVNCNV